MATSRRLHSKWLKNYEMFLKAIMRHVLPHSVESVATNYIPSAICCAPIPCINHEIADFPAELANCSCLQVNGFNQIRDAAHEFTLTNRRGCIINSTQRGLNKMDAAEQTIFSNAFFVNQNKCSCLTNILLNLVKTWQN